MDQLLMRAELTDFCNGMRAIICLTRLRGFTNILEKGHTRNIATYRKYQH